MLNASRYWLPSIALVAALVTLLAYWPGLHGPFLFDDFPNIVGNTRIRLSEFDLAELWGAAFSSQSSYFGRPLSTATFAINYLLGGGEPYSFKLTNLLLHIVTAGAIGSLSLALLRLCSATPGSPPSRTAYWLALVIAAAWALHPLHVSTTLYVVQRMTILATLFMVLSLVTYIHARIRFSESRPGALLLFVGALLLGLLAFASKETAVLLPLYALVLELTILRWLRPKAPRQPSATLLFPVLLCAPIAAGLLILALYPDAFLSGYLLRDFTVSERLLTEGRVVTWYFWSVFVPAPQRFALLHDIPVSASIFTPLATALSYSFLVAVGLCAALALRSKPYVSFGIIWFLAGHTLESTILPLELLFEHRNYLPSFGLIFGATVLVNTYLSTPRARRILPLLVATALTILSGTLVTRTTQWADEELFLRMEAIHHPNSHRAHAMLGQYYAAHIPKATPNIFLSLAQEHFEKTLALKPTENSVRFGLLALRLRHNLTVDGDFLVDMRHHLLNDRLTPSTINGLRGLTRCLTTNECKIDRATFDILIDALLTNDMSVYYLADIHAYAGQYQGHVLRDFSRALSHTTRALQSDPTDLELYFDIARWHIMNGDIDRAREALARLRENDRLGVFASAVDQWESGIAALRLNPVN